MHFLKILFCVVGFLAAFSQLCSCCEVTEFTGSRFYFLAKEAMETLNSVFNTMQPHFLGPATDGSLTLSFLSLTKALKFGSSGCLVDLYHFCVVFSEKFPAAKNLAKKDLRFQLRFILQLYSDLTDMLLDLSETTGRNIQNDEKLRHAKEKLDLALGAMDNYKLSSLSTRKEVAEIKATYIGVPSPLSFAVLEEQYRSALDTISREFLAFIKNSSCDAINPERRVIMTDFIRQLEPLIHAHLFTSPLSTRNKKTIIPTQMLLLKILQSSGIYADFPDVNLSLLSRDFNDAFLALQLVISLTRKYDALITARLVADFPVFQKEATAVTIQSAFLGFLENFWTFALAYSKDAGLSRHNVEDPQLTDFIKKISTADFPHLYELSDHSKTIYWALFEGLSVFVQPRPQSKSSEVVPVPALLQESCYKMKFLLSKFKSQETSFRVRDSRDNLVIVYLRLIKSAAVQIIQENTLEIASVLQPYLGSILREVPMAAPSLSLGEALEKYLPLASDVTPSKIYMLFFLADRCLLVQSMLNAHSSTTFTCTTTSTSSLSSALYCVKDVSTSMKYVLRVHEPTKQQQKSQFKYYSSILAEMAELLDLPQDDDPAAAADIEGDISVFYMAQSNEVHKQYLQYF